jgi:protein TonB
MHAYPGGGTKGRRLGLLAGVVLAHALMLVGLLRALDVRVPTQSITAVMASMILRPLLAPPAAPPPPVVHLAALRPTIPLEVLLPQIELPDPPPAAKAPALAAGSGPGERAGPVRRPIVFVSGPLNENVYYPLDASLHGQSGQVLTLVCIDDQDRILSVKVLKSSGVDQLDRAAIEVARHSLWQPATIDSQAITDCAAFAVDFTLQRLQGIRTAPRARG